VSFFEDDNLEHFETQKEALFSGACDFIPLTEMEYSVLCAFCLPFEAVCNARFLPVQDSRQIYLHLSTKFPVQAQNVYRPNDDSSQHFQFIIHILHIPVFNSE
jgi:hypothetical protein